MKATTIDSPGERAAQRRAVSWESLAFLRFVLAWIVLSGHLTQYSSTRGTWPFLWDAFSGKAAVVGFLLISGFSIASSLDRNSHGFYRRRLLRIYPLYFFAIAFAMVLELISGGHLQLPRGSLQSLSVGQDLENFLFLQTFATRPVTFDGPVWSLAVEVCYYALAPLLGRMSQPSLVVLSAVSFFCYMPPKHADWGLAYLLLSKVNAVNYLWCWLVGFMLWRDSSRRMLLGAMLLGVPAMLWGPFTPEPLAVVTYIISATVIICAGEITLTGKLKEVVDYLGDLSYPLYIFHFPAMIFAWAVFGVRSLDGLALVATGISITALHVIDRGLSHRLLAPLILSKRAAAPGLCGSPQRIGILQPERHPAQCGGAHPRKLPARASAGDRRTSCCSSGQRAVAGITGTRWPLARVTRTALR